MANYNPALEENKRLKKKLTMLLEAKKEGGAVGSSNLKTKLNTIKDDFELYKKRTELEVLKLKRKIEETQTELNNAGSQFGDTQSSFNKDVTEDIEELRTKLSTVSIELENRRKENRKLMAKNAKELEDYYSMLGQDQGEEKKLRVRVRQLENELEQTLKKIDIVSKAKGFTRGRSNSKTKVERTQFRNSGSRKPLYPGGSNYSSPAIRNNNRANKYSPSNKSTGSNYRKNSPSAVSNASKKKTVQPKNSSNKGSPVNRLYSPGGRPREHSPNGSQRKPGAVQRAQEAFSPKSKKGPTKAEIYKRYNGLRNSKDRKSKNGSNASPTNRPSSGSIYSNQGKRVARKGSTNRSNSARSKRGAKGDTDGKTSHTKYANYEEREVKLNDTNSNIQGYRSGDKERPNKSYSYNPDADPATEGREKEISAIEDKISRLEEMLKMAKA
jgi:hypothetical protein